MKNSEVMYERVLKNRDWIIEYGRQSIRSDYRTLRLTFK